MKVSLTNESTGAFFGRPFAKTEVVERSNSVVRDGLMMKPWSDGLPIWRTALSRLPGANLYHCEQWIEALRGSYRLKLEVGHAASPGRVARGRGVRAFERNLFVYSVGVAAIFRLRRAAGGRRRNAGGILRALIASNPASAIEVRGVEGPAPWKNVDCFGSGHLISGGRSARSTPASAARFAAASSADSRTSS